ncbi:MAG TPA: 2'-5' RNA ligase family protein [Nocardioidaceae bacterium]
MTGHSLLVVPLPGLVSVVPPLGRGATLPHIPLVDPFADLPRIDDGVLAELEDYFADVVPFAVRLSEVSEYPGGPAYMAPDPTAPFRRLTQGLLHLFPELPRPRPRFERVPHLSVEMPPGEDLDLLREQLDPWLPVATLARQAALWWQEDGVRTLAMFPFGTSAA